MDVLVLIDKLDDLVHNARPVPLTDQVRVDREEIYDLLDQMRATIPEEIKQARWIVKERQEMLAEAKREAERIVREAREQQSRLISDEEITKQAERAADEIVEDARAPRARDPPRRRGLRRRDPQHARGQPSEVPRRRAARPRSARRTRRRAGRDRAVAAFPGDNAGWMVEPHVDLGRALCDGSIRSKLSFANVIAMIALFLALSGRAYAAVAAKNSVTSKSIKKGAVKSADIANDKGVKSADVGANALTGADIIER